MTSTTLAKPICESAKENQELRLVVYKPKTVAKLKEQEHVVADMEMETESLQYSLERQPQVQNKLVETLDPDLAEGKAKQGEILWMT